MDRQTDGQNYDSQYCASIATSCSKKQTVNENRVRPLPSTSSLCARSTSLIYFCRGTSTAHIQCNWRLHTQTKTCRSVTNRWSKVPRICHAKEHMHSYTSNMTVVTEPSGWLQSAITTTDVLCVVSHIFAYWTSWSSVTDIIFFIIECGIMCFLCAMHVFDVQASSSPPRLHLCKMLFLMWPPFLS